MSNLETHQPSRRYEIKHRLGTGAFGTVFYAFDHLYQQDVAYKKVNTEPANVPLKNLDSLSSTSKRLALAHEFQVMSSLRHPNIVNVLDYGFDDHKNPYFTMQLIENAQTITEAATLLPPREKLQLIIQLLQALSYLHQRGIIHRDLKPSNALVDADGEVKVLDFGVALNTAGPAPSEPDAAITGTLAYISPEIYEGGEPTETSDIYSVGVILYEMFVGKHPFDVSSMGALVFEVLTKDPDLSVIEALDVNATLSVPRPKRGSLPPTLSQDDETERIWDLPSPDDRVVEDLSTLSVPLDEIKETVPAALAEDHDSETDIISSDETGASPYSADMLALQEFAGSTLADMVDRLLAKQPEHRFQTAQEVITAICAISGIPLPTETIDIRESYLQAANFVGRHDEMKLLLDSLAQLQYNKFGGAWIIGGESGVGKSRLIKELRVEALVSGVEVLHGQGSAGGGLSYQLWREPLRRLVLSASINDDAASILKQVVPDIAVLLGRPVADPPKLEGTAGKSRLIDTIVQLFRVHRSPLLLILEDLHWANESLDVLNKLLLVTADLPLMILGSYRNDERPDLPDKVKGIRVIRLERFAPEDIRELSISMLGKNGEDDAILDLLEKETEGNVFFLVEVVRALAEEAGRLSQIAHMTLPHQVFSHGIQTVVERRLDKVPAEAREILNVAAIIGRQIDADLLMHLFERVDMDNWITVCANAAVIDIQDGLWQFAHDKLREGILDTLDPPFSEALHRRVAKGLQVIYESDLAEYAAQIAGHYQNANDLLKAADWHLRAGNSAESAFAYVNAMQHYSEALNIWQDSLDTVAPEKLAEVYRGLGHMHNRLAEFSKSVEMYEAMLSIAISENNTSAQATAKAGIAWAFIYQGNLKESYDSALQCVELARAADALAELNEGLQIMGWSSLSQGKNTEALAIAEDATEIARQSGDKARIANSLNLLGAATANQGRYNDGKMVFEQALAIAHELGDRQSATTFVANLAIIAIRRGDYEDAAARSHEALEFARQSGDKPSEMDYLYNLGYAQVMQGDYDTAIDTLHDVLAMADNTPFRKLAITHQALAEAYLGIGFIEEAFESAKLSLQSSRQVQSPEYTGRAWRILGQVAAASGNLFTDDDKRFSASDCFIESKRILQEINQDNELALTLQRHAEYEFKYGDQTFGHKLWNQARELYVKIGADLISERMNTTPMDD